MSKVKPDIISNSNPVGLDKVISDLQTVIGSTEFINESGANELYFSQGLLLPLAHLDEATGEPIVYWKNKDYYPAKPNDNYRVIGFFYQEDPNNPAGINESVYNLHFVCWFNQDKYVRNKNVLIREYFIEELRKKIRNYLRMENKSTIAVIRESDAVFSRFTLTEKTRLKYPYQGFRINFQVTKENDCADTLLNLSI